ncbi:DUF5682 family protein [Streptomyces sp. WMMC500]|uniref:DUF5682 family protein n=1 Tax=Streptomyces sp. WMMC500 TaxID=3015154 RepID=UPI00248AC0CF|nr:DUF5682 family protein [Streptomyces sp. WMMC500]WBB64498.1 DUF5682 family protein [Streptomyces sp. WMMC500]
MVGEEEGRRGAAAGAPAVEPLLLGVRHHGPGSARGVAAALDAYRPRVVLVEGPPEADAIVGLAGEEDMRPPVALLAHAVDEPARAGFWPLAHFSPEWVAIRWALGHGVPVRFIDLPAAHTLAMAEAGRPAPGGPGAEEGTPGTADADPDADADTDADTDAGSAGGEERAALDPEALRIDPLAVLAGAAGYDDPERWWEDAVEHRMPRGAEPAAGGTAGPPGTGGDVAAPFVALGEAMGALRERYGDGGHDRDLVREAHMRLRLREARREADGRVAVVCGAWHVPALRERTTVTADRRLLKGLPKVRTEVAWVPWTHRRLARRSGYGAGIDSPGWYAHLFEVQDRPVERWLIKVADLLRAEGRTVSSAHVIEAVRLTTALAAMRGRPLAGLAETLDAVRAVMCDGSEVPLALVADRLVVGDALGEVPESAPAVPLQRDLARTQRALRLKPAAEERELQLDLRKETDAGRSRLLHRLRLLGVDWGVPAASRASTGTFRETWSLRWEPDLSVRVVEAALWGTTVVAAATAKAEYEAAQAGSLAEVTALAEQCLLAELTDALPVAMRALADRAALDTDVGHLAQALPALARSVRYGDVRGTQTTALADVATGLADRIFVGLPGACVGLDADGAQEMRTHVDAVHGAVALLDASPPGADQPDAASEGGAATPGAPVDGHGRRGAEGGGVRGRIPGAPATDTGVDEDPAQPGQDAAAAAGAGAGDARSEDAAADDGGRGEAGRSEEGSAGPRRRGGAAPGDAGSVRGRWAGALRVLGSRDAVPGLIRGRAVRLLLDEGRMPAAEAERVMGLALSHAVPPADAAVWVEGFLGGDGGMLLVHDERLLALVDGWLTGLSGDAFTDVLPLLRRTFAEYEPGARRALGELVRRGASAAGPAESEGLPGFADEIDAARAAAVLPTLRALLGTEEGQP